MLFFIFASSRKRRVLSRGDPVTEGPSKAAFREEVRKLFAEKNILCALVSMQSTELPGVLSTYGPDTYNRALRMVFDVISGQLGKNAPVVRTGENTFCLALKTKSENEIRSRLSGIADMIELSAKSEFRGFSLPSLFGVYLPQSADGDIDEMLSKAVQARMYSQSGERILFYSHELSEKISGERELAESMLAGLEKKDFTIFYQPKVGLSDLRAAGAEALVRWRHPQRGLLSAGMFVPAAEKYGVINRIELWVFGEICSLLKRWNDEGRETCPISMNLSGADIKQEGMVEEFYEICRNSGVSPGNIEFEFKESLIADMPEASRSFIDRLHAHGFRCAVDGFTSSSCSMQFLSTLNIDTIKLDGSFFSGENNSRQGRYILESILRLAAQLHIQTVAEGVDSRSQLQYLQQAACDIIQGFYYFKPMPPERLEEKIFSGSELRCIDDGMEAAAKTQEAADPSRQLQQPYRNIILFSYWPAEDFIEFSDSFSPIFNGQTSFENASTLLRTTNLIHENDRKDFVNLLDRCKRGSGWVENTLRFYVAEKRYAWLELRLRQDRHGGVSRLFGMLVNMEGWKNEINRWKDKATRDVLTGLYNREYFEQSTKKLLSSGACTSAALLFIDVDDFKQANDTYGHVFGDDVLCCIAKQILSIFRHTDIVARYGGDEFVIFAPSIERSVIEQRLVKLYGVFGNPYRSDAVQYHISGSIGAAMYPEAGSDYETLLEHADSACYEAKKMGKNHYVIYEPHTLGKGSGSAPA
ncbi:MAG: EAL domain-containing protein [Oscillospiraceae bacterium]|nr:EAL domain-containing protein [Oscillospiraceae bacterium]